ncbi:hypothetical protein G6F60_014482 [Rhizopus arrhizus]|nr:hypothetical protein G6F60_014482 [Rhizopus arrhizus]
MYWRGSRLTPGSCQSRAPRARPSRSAAPRDAERGAQVVLRAQHADAATRGHLPARKGRSQAAGRRIGAGLAFDGFHRPGGAGGRGGLGLGCGLTVDDAQARQRSGHAGKSSDFHIGIECGKRIASLRKETENRVGSRSENGLLDSRTEGRK